MKHASLAAHYRPQTFAEVTGQDMITTVLSRAAAEDRMAAAYLLSGTRGVGKTTIARILAKALNCVNAPTAEPCNVCANCQMITKGNHVDVTEIDGASNNSVEDARALRENIGYAPMEGRYKVFIIDEAHMLSRSAFNALLKTLEEPPPRVVFIFATTEVHKFPITIVSRCQHFIFKRLSEDGLVAHLSRVLGMENIDFDPQAVRTIARRANGSVRDSMSLLGQTLALGESSLSMESTRAVLGLAGQELFITLMEAIAKQDCPAVIELMHKLSDQGIDMGFFLRELINLWRTLFLLREAGQSIVPSLNMSQEESTLWLNLAAKFSAPHLHAAWHMTLDAQRKVIHSPEPAAALELLLINLTFMPRLLPLSAAPMPAANTASTPAPNSEEEKKNSPELKPHADLIPAQSPEQYTGSPSEQVAPQIQPEQTAYQGQQKQQGIQKASAHLQVAPKATAPPKTMSPAPFESMPEKPMMEEPPAYLWEDAPPMDMHHDGAIAPSEGAQYSEVAHLNGAPVPVSAPHAAIETPTQSHNFAQTLPSWEEIIQLLSQGEPPLIIRPLLQQTQGHFSGNELHIYAQELLVYQQFERKMPEIQKIIDNFCKSAIHITLHREEKVFKSDMDLVREFSAHAALKDCLEILDASIYKVHPPNK